jgi:hypothetical protein
MGLVKTFAEAVQENLTKYTRAFGIEQAETEEAEFASKAEITAFTAAWLPPSGGNDTSALEALIAAGHKEINLLPGTFTFNNLTGLRKKEGITIRGAGKGVTIVQTTSKTGYVVDLTEASFIEWTDMTIASTVQRTAGAFFYVDKGSGSSQQNAFRRLWLLSGWQGIVLNNTSTNIIEDVQIGDSGAWEWSSALALTGKAISTIVRGLRGGTGYQMAAGAVVLSGAEIDTFHGSQWDLATESPATKMAGLVVSGGEWIKLVDCSIESGPEGYPLTVNAGKQVHLVDCHLLGRIALNGGEGTKIIGGEAILSSIHGVQLAGGTNSTLIGLAVTDVGEGYSGILVAAGVSSFSIIGCDIGYDMVLATKPAHLIEVEAGASEYYVITGNRGSGNTGEALLDQGTGIEKNTSGNEWNPAVLARGEAQLTAGKATVKTAAATTTSIILVNGLSGTVIGMGVKERKAGEFVVEATATSTDKFAWAILA